MIGFTCHNESMLIGVFRQKQFADERKWLSVSAVVRGAGTRDEPLRTSALEATSYSKAKKKKKNTIPCIRKLHSIKIKMKTMKHLNFFQYGFNSKASFTEKLKK